MKAFSAVLCSSSSQFCSNSCSILCGFHFLYFFFSFFAVFKCNLQHLLPSQSAFLHFPPTKRRLIGYTVLQMSKKRWCVRFYIQHVSLNANIDKEWMVITQVHDPPAVITQSACSAVLSAEFPPAARRRAKPEICWSNSLRSWTTNSTQAPTRRATSAWCPETTSSTGQGLPL